MTLDPAAVTAVIREVVDTEVLPRFRNLSDGDIHTKTGPNDLVTEADLKAEVALTRRLTDLLPGSVAVGEEAVHADAAVLDRLSGAAPVWVIDPVDGTGNFTRGDSRFACIVALVIDGETVAGWIDHCVERRTAVAERGGGCWLGERRLTVSEAPDQPLSSFVGQVGGAPVFKALKPRVGKLLRCGSAAHAYLSLVTGAADFSAFTRLKPWDHAAGILMHLEAGGHNALRDGTRYRPTLSSGWLLMARDATSWHRLEAVMPKG